VRSVILRPSGKIPCISTGPRVTLDCVDAEELVFLLGGLRIEFVLFPLDGLVVLLLFPRGGLRVLLPAGRLGL
jgi:hypothetical protein